MFCTGHHDVGPAEVDPQLAKPLPYVRANYSHRLAATPELRQWQGGNLLRLQLQAGQAPRPHRALDSPRRAARPVDGLGSADGREPKTGGESRVDLAVRCSGVDQKWIRALAVDTHANENSDLIAYLADRHGNLHRFAFKVPGTVAAIAGTDGRNITSGNVLTFVAAKSACPLAERPAEQAARQTHIATTKQPS